jgi:hypothetical protein
LASEVLEESSKGHFIGLLKRSLRVVAVITVPFFVFGEPGFFSTASDGKDRAVERLRAA